MVVWAKLLGEMQERMADKKELPGAERIILQERKPCFGGIRWRKVYEQSGESGRGCQYYRRK